MCPELNKRDGAADAGTCQLNTKGGTIPSHTHTADCGTHGPLRIDLIGTGGRGTQQLHNVLLGIDPQTRWSIYRLEKHVSRGGKFPFFSSSQFHYFWKMLPNVLETVAEEEAAPPPVLQMRFVLVTLDFYLSKFPAKQVPLPFPPCFRPAEKRRPSGGERVALAKHTNTQWI